MTKFEIVMNENQAFAHKRALKYSRTHQRIEWRLVTTLQEVESTAAYRVLGYTSMFQYAVHALGFSESVAYAFITVARKAAEIAILRDALKAQRISVNKACRIASALTSENATELIEFACSHTTRELDFEVRRLNPRAARRDRIRVVAEDQVEVRMIIPKALHEKVARVQSLLAQKGAKDPDIAAALDAMTELFLFHQDPVQKAEHAEARKAKKSATGELCANRVQSTIQETKRASASAKRIRLKAKERHPVSLKDRGQCSFVGPDGRRCANDRWLHIHHIKPVSQGGTNDPGNLTTLCSQHHELVHQTCFGIDGQVTWLRAPMREYVA